MLLSGDFLGGEEPLEPYGIHSLSSVGTHPRRSLTLECSSALCNVLCSKCIESNQQFGKTRDQQRLINSEPPSTLPFFPTRLPSLLPQYDKKTKEQKQQSPCELLPICCQPLPLQLPSLVLPFAGPTHCGLYFNPTHANTREHKYFDIGNISVREHAVILCIFLAGHHLS